jgi:3-oxoacyl-[acyl-carrier protein] reductase
MTVSIDLSGKTALVTGSSRGIGRAAAKMLASAGARVALNYVQDDEAAEAAAAAIREAGGEAMAVRGDVSEPHAARSLVDRVVSNWRRLDILVNNAGIWEPDPAGEGGVEVWDRTLAVNLRGAYLVTDAAIPHLAKHHGCLIFVSSTAGQRGEAGHGAYASSKGALISYTKSLAAELGPRGIRVNCVAPGWVETDMTSETFSERSRLVEIERTIPLGHVGKPEDIAGGILFLASDLARFVQGEILNVNGGSVLAG